MSLFRADLHIHSVVSPCANLDMSPTNIINYAVRHGINILGITDHNSTRHSRLMVELGRENDILVLPGVEINTQEEVHCLAFFETVEIADKFQIFLDKHLPFIENDTDKFGFQLVVDRDENIVDEIEVSLFSALTADIETVARAVHRLNGIFIPAHIDRPYYGLYSQLGFLPKDLQTDALELSANANRESYIASKPELQNKTIIRNSDAHSLEKIGTNNLWFDIENPTFNEIKLALSLSNGRNILLK